MNSDIIGLMLTSEYLLASGVLKANFILLSETNQKTPRNQF